MKYRPVLGKNVPFHRLFRFATSLDILCMLIGSIFSLVSALFEPYLIILYGDLTENILEYIRSNNGTSTEKELVERKLTEATKHFAINISASGAGIIISTYLTSILFSYAADRQIFKLRQVLLEKTLHKDISWYDTHQTGDFATVFTENVAKWEDAISEKFGIFLYHESVFVVCLIVSLFKGWKLALVCFVSLPLTTSLMSCISWISSKLSQQEMQSYAEAGAVAEEAFSSIRTVFAFDGQKKEIDRYNKHLMDAKKSNTKKNIFNAFSNGLMWLFFYCSYSLCWWYGIGLILDERNLPEEDRVNTPGNIVTISITTMIASWNYQTSALFVELFAAAKGAANKIFFILDEDEPKINKIEATAIKPAKFTSSVRFEGVSFKYPARPEVEVLQDFNLDIRCGDTVALVGTSGCGKTTCVQLLQRFYDPDEGKIYIDKNDIKDIDISCLRRKIGVVSQEPSLFATTISENIRFGKLSATQSEIEAAAKKANVHEFIVNLPRGYETIVGERGTQLSGGQKQRIAIARALVRQPEILILDEATSALDTTSEAEVQAALEKVSGECTTIIVAHRLSTIRRANVIIFISNGKVVEKGTHCELMAAKGDYHKMVLAQGKNEEQKEMSTSVGGITIQEKLQQIDTNEEQTCESKEKVMGSMSKILEMSRPEWKQIVCGCFGSVVNGITLPLYGILFGSMIKVLSNVDDENAITQRNRICLYSCIIGVICGLSHFLQHFFLSSASENLTLRIRKMAFRTMLKQEISWYDRTENSVGSLCSKLSGDASSVQGAAGVQIGSCLQFLATFLLSCFYPLYLNWKLALVLLSFFPLILLFVFLEKKIIQNDAKENQRVIEESTKFAVEAITNIRTVISLGCEPVFLDLFQRELVIYQKMAHIKSHIRGLFLGFARSIHFFTYSAAFTYGVNLIETKEIEYDKLFTIAQVTLSGAWSIGIALSFTPNFQKGFLAAGRLYSLLGRVPTIKNIVNADRNIWNDETVNYTGVSFSYPTRSLVTVLNSLNLSIPKGKTVALVGPSGCGKSTILQLLERFYDPTEGKVVVDGKDIKIMDLNTLRSQLGIVSQEPNLFDRTIAENIAYGVNHKDATIDEIITAAKSANIHNFITCLPQAYDTRLGSKGTQLSGGQKQRVAIARALIRKPKILLLDEATSALDNESEKVVQEALNNAKKDRTCIIIAHRLTTIQDADIICVMKEGSVVEIGTHLELLERRGLYHKFYSLQSGQR
uniref:ABC-type xenobiotic transporter n=1 Tax=Leptinotarsa decemlineata TaxID=7539 RepID=A0A6F9FCL8_LEPDE|nr:TPA_exp: multidrug resistance transporter 3 [Leptinotarsa decemlineata]